MELLKLLDTANAPPRKMAEVISHRTGDSYNSKDVKNLLTKAKKKENEVDGLEKHLDKVRRNGGTVLVDKDKKTVYVNAMIVQTKEMKEMLSRVKPGCNIFLCSVHMYRYFREKVLPSSKMSSGEAVDKVTIVNTLKQMRDAPTEDIYDDLKDEITDRLLVKPGNTKPFVTFHYYFDKNWHSCRPMWVFCHRKTFPTMGVREVAESTFRALKHYEKLEFGRTSPRLEGMIPIIIKVLKNRHKERLQRIMNKRLVCKFFINFKVCKSARN